MEWYEELDYDENPFEVNTRMVGQENLLDEAYYTIMSGNILVIEGDEGTGKTKLLREVIRKFGGKGKVVYMNSKQIEKELNIEDIVVKKSGFMGWLFKKYPKNMVLLLDDVEKLSEKNNERIKYLFDMNHIKAVIFATKNPNKLNFTESLLQRIRKNMQVETLSDYEAVQVIREKVGNNCLNDRIIKEVYHQSDKNMKKFLENSETVCKAYVDNKEITEKDVNKILAKEGK
ncbi:AAA family ATPase [archaeon]|jgi:chromosomal replication initiation ATPase DnaA|nr:AAA family ATPase [archaeon]MBT4416645.1 AAA family ATPase [archaeon]